MDQSFSTNNELLKLIEHQQRIIEHQNTTIEKLVNENAEQENMINELMKEQLCFLT
jgi:uncharacterized membrane-anchored protein YhcB (DUF1043 family)